MTVPPTHPNSGREPEQLARGRTNELEAIVDAVPDGLVLIDASGRIVRMNQAAKNLLGCTHAHAETDLQQCFARLKLRLSHSPGIPDVDQLLLSPARRGETVRDVLMALDVAETGRTQWISAGAVPIVSDGATGSILITFTDITETHEAQQRADAVRGRFEKERQRQHEFSLALLQAAPAGICVLDGRNLRVKYANQAYLEYLEEPFRSEGVTNRTLEEFVPLAAEQGLVDVFRQVVATGQPHIDPEYRHEGFGRGSTYWRWSLLPFYHQPDLDDEAQILADSVERDVVIVAVEITEHVEARRQLEMLLARSEDQSAELSTQAQELAHLSSALELEKTRLATIIENMRVGVVLAEAPEGRIVVANPSAEIIWGQSIAFRDPSDWDIVKGFRPDGRPYLRHEWPLARSLRSGEVVHSEEIDFVRVNGTGGTMGVSSAPIRDREGRIVAGVASFYDITERKEAERALRRTSNELQSLLRISRTLVSTLQLPELLKLFVRELRSIIACDGVIIYLLDDAELVVQEYVGPLPREEALSIRLSVDTAVGLGDVIRERRAIYIDDLDRDSPIGMAWHAPDALQQRRLAGEDARSYLAVPIMVKNRPIGILCLTHKQPDRFSAEHARLAEAIANQAAIAIENAQLYREAQEVAVLEERQRLARDLHDSVSQAIFGVSMATHSALANWEMNPSRARERVESAQVLAKTAQAEMRALIFELRPDQIATDGLVKALELQTAALQERRSFRLDVALCEELDLPLPVKEAFYRIAQEALHNAVRHAKPRHMTVKLSHEHGATTLRVTDDGIGFNPNDAYPGHFGLRSMKERAARIGATLTIESAPNRGSAIILTHVIESRSEAPG